MLWFGYAWYRIQARIRALETVDISAAESGLVKMTGEASPAEDAGTVTPPLSGIESLAYEFRIQWYKPDADGSNWHSFESQTDRRRLHVEDATGTAVVDPEKFDLMLEQHEIVVEDRAEAPPEVRSFLDDSEHGDEVFRGRKTRFVERRLEPGEEAFVVGHASDRAPSAPIAGPTTHISRADNPGLKKWLGEPLVLSDKDESAVVDQQTGWGKAAVMFGCYCRSVSRCRRCSRVSEPVCSPGVRRAGSKTAPS